MGFLHVCSTIHLLFYLKLYCLCLTIIDEKLRTTVEKLNEYSGLENIQLGSVTERKEEKILRQCLVGFNIIEELIQSCSCHFSIQLIVQTLFFVCVLTGYLFFGIFAFVKADYIATFFSVFYVVLVFWQAYAITTECTCISLIIKRVLCYLFAVDAEKVSSKLHQNVNSVAFKISASPPTISPGQYFTVNRQLLSSVSTSLATFVIIMIQFKVSDHCNDNSQMN
ncbi:unnamed protein product [Allacma fusca]|uniref:Gustatory receptor n=1 Tax=Allacma fusca TaxID=39272 RepID=A0A8J2LG29_9HEXA|nr:unnamed protein product [Allacma fusca]